MHGKTIVFALAAVLAVVGTVVASIAFTNRQRPSRLDACKTTGAKHLVVISNGVITPKHIDAKRCDRMEVLNRDDITREIGFGNHDHHVAYDGISEQVIGKDESVNVVLDQPGEYHFHDHFHDEVEATFTVTR